jgi:hypothetical protein
MRGEGTAYAFGGQCHALTLRHVMFPLPCWMSVTVVNLLLTVISGAACLAGAAETPRARAVHSFSFQGASLGFGVGKGGIGVI